MTTYDRIELQHLRETADPSDPSTVDIGHNDPSARGGTSGSVRSGGLQLLSFLRFRGWSRSSRGYRKLDKVSLPGSVETLSAPVDEWYAYPTEEELHGPNKLRRVSDDIPWPAYLIAFIEFCERFSYDGTAAVFTNFIQRPLPPGSVTGAGGADRVSGALGLGTKASTGLTTFNSFYIYVIPMFGAYIADTRLGRFETVCWCTGIALIGHCIMIVSALPSVIVDPHGALACFIVALIIMGLGTGGFKASISPLIAEQYNGPDHLVVKPLDSGERVVVDPGITAARIYLYFYWVINIGALFGSLSMTYAEKYVGFWLAYAFPTIMFLLCPLVLFYGRNVYHRSPPSGSVVGDALRVCRMATRGVWSLNPVKTMRNLHNPHLWDKAKPSVYMKAHPGNTPTWMTFDDAFVDEVRKGLRACQVFLFYPFYWISFSQLNNNLISQAATMTTHGTPNDVIYNVNPLALIICIPVFDIFLYPALRRAGINFTPLKRIFTGFMIVSTAMAWGAVVQYHIYLTSPCGFYANGPSCDPSPLSVWIQTGSYVLIAFSEIFTSITGLEYAYTKAPKAMRSLVMAAFLSTTAAGSAISEALNPLSADPLLIWNYTICGGASFVAGILFWFTFYQLDREEASVHAVDQRELEDKPD